MVRKVKGRPGITAESGGLIDDSGFPKLVTEKNLHLYEFTSFDMLIVFLTMSGFLACFAQFNIRPAVIFCVNLALLVIVRIWPAAIIQKIALSWSVISYSCIIATQSTPIGPTIDYFWAIPFIFTLTGFRFISLFGMTIIVLVVHVFFVSFTDALHFGMSNQSFAMSLDIIFFFINLFFGISAYMLFFVLGLTAWRLRKHPEESLESVPLLENSELITFSQLPMGLVLSRGNVMSDEQHLFILLRLAQHTPYRDLLLQLMRPTEKELAHIVEADFVDDRTFASIDSSGSISRQPTRTTTFAAQRGVSDIGSTRDTSRVNNGFAPEFDIAAFQRYALSGINVPIIGEGRDTEFTNLRQFLRSALCQLMLETHPGRDVCEDILVERGFHGTRQQMEAALLAYNARKKKLREAGELSPRLRVDSSEMRLWSSTDPNQKQELPLTCQELLLPEILTVIIQHCINLGRPLTVGRLYHDQHLHAQHLRTLESKGFFTGLLSTIKTGYGPSQSKEQFQVQSSTLRRTMVPSGPLPISPIYSPIRQKKTLETPRKRASRLSTRMSTRNSLRILKYIKQKRSSLIEGTESTKQSSFTSKPKRDTLRKSIIDQLKITILHNVRRPGPFKTKETTIGKQRSSQLRKEISKIENDLEEPFTTLTRQSTVLTFDAPEGWRGSRPSLVSILQASGRRPWRPSLLTAILGLQDAQVRWISKDVVGFPQGIKDESWSRESAELVAEPIQRQAIEGWVTKAAKPLPSRKIERVLGPLWRWVSSLKRRAKKKKTKRGGTGMGKWALVQHCVFTLFTFRLQSPTKRKGLMPSKHLGGAFKDLKIERWYLSWSTYIEAFMIVKMRETLILITTIEIGLTIGQIILHYLIVAGEQFLETGEIIFFWLSCVICFLQTLFAIRIFYQLRPSEFGNHSHSHLFKLRSTALGATLAAISLFDYFLNPASTIYHVQDLSDLQIVYLIALRSMKGVYVHCTLFAFPFYCLCSERAMANFVILTSIFLFLIAPFISYFCGTWPVLTVGSVQTPQKMLTFQYSQPQAQVMEASSRSQALWTHYFSLIHQFAPCLMLQYVFAWAIQATLRRLFGRHGFLYLLYVDALALLEVEEEKDEDEALSREMVKSEHQSNVARSPISDTERRIPSSSQIEPSTLVPSD